MKKIYFVLFSAVALLSTQSCMKCDRDEHRAPVVTKQTVDASVNENTAYSYTLPAMPGGSTSQITVAPAHAGSSVVTTDANGNNVYQYTPATNYAGADVVVITTQSDEGHGNSSCFGGPGPGNCGNHGGNCGNHNTQTVITTIDLTVTPVSSNVVTAKLGDLPRMNGY